MNSYFMLVSPTDTPLYEFEYPQRDKATHLNQFILHASLDLLEIHIAASQNPYLKIIDKFNEWFVSAYVSPSGMRFLLLHDVMNTDGIRHFFTNVHELYVKALLNPLSDASGGLSPAFDGRVRVLARKWL